MPIEFGRAAFFGTDLFVADLDAYRRSGAWADITTLHLVIEVLSPSSVRADRFTKRRLYQEQRVPAYWIVDIDRGEIEVWTPHATLPTIESRQVGWRHPAADRDCVIDLQALFRPG